LMHCKTSTGELIDLEMNFPPSFCFQKGAKDDLRFIPSNENSGDVVDWCFN
jgi:hypothetical protein